MSVLAVQEAFRMDLIRLDWHISNSILCLRPGLISADWIAHGIPGANCRVPISNTSGKRRAVFTVRRRHVILLDCGTYIGIRPNPA